jgi:TolB-like protein
VLGQVQREGSRVRVVVHLIRTADQEHLWADRVEHDSADALALEREVAERLAAAVAERLLGTAPGP